MTTSLLPATLDGNTPCIYCGREFRAGDDPPSTRYEMAHTMPPKRRCCPDCGEPLIDDRPIREAPDAGPCPF